VRLFYATKREYRPIVFKHVQTYETELTVMI